MKKKVTHFKIKKRQLMLSLVFAMLIFILTFPLLTFLVIYHGRVYPGVYIDTINVSGLTINEADSLLTSQKKFADTINIRLIIRPIIRLNLD